MGLSRYSALVLSCLLAGCGTTRGVAPQQTTASLVASSHVSSGAWFDAYESAELNALIAMGWQANSGIRTARLRAERARQQKQARGGAIDLTGSTRTQGRASGFDSSASQNYAASQSASLAFDFAGGRSASLRALGLEATAAGIGIRRAMQTFAADLVIALADARFQSRASIIQQDAVASRQRTLKAARARERAGIGTRLDVVRTRVQVADAKADRTERARLHDLSVGAVAETIGVLKPLVEPILNAVKLSPRADGQQPELVEADVARGRPDVAQAELAYIAAMERVGVARAALYPSLTLDGSITISAATIGIGAARQWSFGPTVNIPLFNRGRLKADVAVAVTNAKLARQNWEDIVRNAVREIVESLDAMKYGRDLLAERRKAVTSSERALAMARRGLKQGNVTVDVVLELEQTVTETALALAEAERALLLADARYHLATAATVFTES